MILVVFAASTIQSCTPTVKSERAEVRPAPAAGNQGESTGGPPPLVVDLDAPLLLDEPTEEQQAFAGMTTQAAVENAACFVCHANYRSELLANQHAGANVGCSGCHGEHRMKVRTIIWDKKTENSSARTGGNKSPAHLCL